MPFPGSRSKAARVCSVHVWAKECCDRSFCCVFALKKAKRKKCVSPWVGDDSSAWAAGADHPFSCHQSQGRVFPWAVSSSECIAVLGERGTGSWGGGFLGWRLVCAALSTSPAGAAHVSSMLLVQALPAQDCNLLEQRSLLTPP